jgi:hypothetical protein
VDLTQQGGNVVATGSGSIDLTGLSLGGVSFEGGGIIFPSLGTIVTAPFAVTPLDTYSGMRDANEFRERGQYRGQQRQRRLGRHNRLEPGALCAAGLRLRHAPVVHRNLARLSPVSA